MERFDYNSLIALSNKELLERFSGKRIRATSHDIVTVGIVNTLFSSYGYECPQTIKQQPVPFVGFVLDDGCSVSFAPDIIVEILS